MSALKIEFAGVFAACKNLARSARALGTGGVWGGHLPKLAQRKCQRSERAAQRRGQRSENASAAKGLAQRNGQRSENASAAKGLAQRNG